MSVAPQRNADDPEENGQIAADNFHAFRGISGDIGEGIVPREEIDLLAVMLQGDAAADSNAETDDDEDRADAQHEPGQPRGAGLAESVADEPAESINDRREVHGDHQSTKIQPVELGEDASARGTREQSRRS